MSADETARATWRLDLADEAATAALASEVAGFITAGDLITLSGDLGAGKTTFARALIRRLCDDPDMEAPSPTFTLMQIYDGQEFPIVHADLYRIKSPDELAELGWDEAADGALVIVEWADRIGAGIASNRLDICLTLEPGHGDSYRQAQLTGFGGEGEHLSVKEQLPEQTTELCKKKYYGIECSCSKCDKR